MSSQPLLPESERRWLHALLVLGTFVLGFLLLGMVAEVLIFFSDILFILVMAWLLAFVLSPLVSVVLRAFPTLPRGLVTILVYLVIFIVLTVVVVLAAQSLVRSIAGFISELPTLSARLPEILAPWQERLRGFGLNVDLVAAFQSVLNGLAGFGGDLVTPLAGLAVASVGAVGNLLLIVFLSLFILMDKDSMVAFMNRMIPPRWADEARLFQTSVASSFGGFMRGQAIQGLIYAAFAVATHLILGLDFMPASAALVGLLQALPFFGAFVSWAPPVVVAALTNPGALLPAFAIMAVGWFIVMNIVQPRVMASAVGIHPVVVLASVLTGLKLYGITGAIFAVPVAAVISAFFFFYLNRRGGGSRDVTSRAARRVEQREGRRVRVPAAPPIAPDVDPPRDPPADPPRDRPADPPRDRPADPPSDTVPDPAR